MNVKRALYVLIAFIVLIVIIPTTTLAASKMPTGTKVGIISVENKTDEEIRTMLENEILIWQAKGDLTLEGEFDTLSIDREAIHFDIDATLEELKDKTKRKISTFFKRPKNVYIPLVTEVDEAHSDFQQLMEKSHIEYESVITKVTEVASDLQDGPVTLTYIEDAEIPLDTVAEVKLEIPNLSTATLDYVVEELDGQLIAPNEMFSFLESVDTPEKLLNSRDESSFLATGLYTLFLQAEFEVLERNPQLTLPDYGEKGINAEVSQRDRKDLVVKNIGESSYRLSLDKGKKNLTFTLEGSKEANTYEVKVENEQEIKPRTIYRYSKKMNPGEQEVVQAGKSGLTLDVIRSIYEDGTYVDDEVISRDLYLPTPTILLVSPDEPDIEEGDSTADDELLDEDDIFIDEEGNIVIPSGTSGGSIVDSLPSDIKDNAIVQQIEEIDDIQKRYSEFLDSILKIYESSIDSVDPDTLEAIKIYEERIVELEALMMELVKELVEEGVLDKAFIEKIEGGAK